MVGEVHAPQHATGVRVDRRVDQVAGARGSCTCHARRSAFSATKTTSLARSPPAKRVERCGPVPPCARGATSGARASVRAFASASLAPRSGVVLATAMSGLGEPSTLMIRPSAVTLAISWLPIAGMPP